MSDDTDQTGYTDDAGHSMGEHDEQPPENNDVQQAVLDIVRRSARRQSQVQTFLVAIALLTAAVVIGSLWFTIELQQHVREEAKERETDEKERRKDSAAAVADALAAIKQDNAERFEAHDARTAAAHAEQLDKIAQLLGRPAGVPVDPVIARGMGGTTSPPRATVPRSSSTTGHPAPRATTPKPAPRASGRPAAPPASPAPAPTTTTPNQKSCEKHPGGPKC